MAIDACTFIIKYLTASHLIYDGISPSVQAVSIKGSLWDKVSPKPEACVISEKELLNRN